MTGWCCRCGSCRASRYGSSGHRAGRAG
jgi:hypothetical protein